MKKYKIMCYPNWESYSVEVEAETIEDALKEAESIANQNCSFMASEDDVEILEEDVKS